MVEQGSPKSLVGVRFSPGLPKKRKFMKATSFLQECKAELQKVQWPGREEVVNSTIIVLVNVIIFSLFLFIADGVFFKALRWLWNLVA